VGSAARIPESTDIQAQLQRILADPSFQRTRQLSALLSYLVEQTLAGHGDALKAVAIAQSVFRRDESFDAQTDTIVRVEAGRLRRRLAQYYESAGCDDPLVIEIPKGGYKPKFQDQRAKAEALTQSRSLEDRPEAVVAARMPLSTAGNIGRWLMFAALLAVILLLVLRQGGRQDVTSPVDVKPFVMVIPVAH